MTIVLVDTTRIQSYIFGTNRLREHIGASFLVAQATSTWVLETIDFLTAAHNIDDVEDLSLHDTTPDPCHIEVVFVGGGRAVLRVESDLVEAFKKHLTHRVLKEAEGVRLHVVGTKRKSDESFEACLQRASEAMEQQQRSTLPPAPLLGLGVTRMGDSSGLPAVDFERGAPVSYEVACKHRAFPLAQRRLDTAFTLPDAYVYPTQLDDLGRTSGQESYIAVVHADGNDVGHYLHTLTRDAPDDATAIARRRAFSAVLQQASHDALNTVKKQVHKRIHATDTNPHVIDAPSGVADLTLVVKNGRAQFPLCPLVFGGDDVTFVCDGRLGLALTRVYLNAFACAFTNLASSNPHLKNHTTLTASAGVAFVKSHYPFARAYALAEELTGTAKAFRRKYEVAGATLDWYFAPTGIAGPLETLRQRQYRTPQGHLLTLRPVMLTPPDTEAPTPLRTWPVVEKALQAFQGKDTAWKGRRNKMKALRQVLRQGRSAVQRFVAAHDPPLLLPELGTDDDDRLRKEGWRTTNDGVRCAYFDALELVDHYIDRAGPLGQRTRHQGL